MKINIKKLEKSYFEQLYFLYDKIDEMHHDSIPFIYKRSFNKEDIKSHLDNILLSKYHNMLIAFDKNENVLGFGEYIIRKIENHKIFEDKTYIDITCIIVKEEYRGKGIGTEILKHIEKQSISLQINSIELMVWGFNAVAMEFYESNGYTTLFKKLHKKAHNSL